MLQNWKIKISSYVLRNHFKIQKKSHFCLIKLIIAERAASIISAIFRTTSSSIIYKNYIEMMKVKELVNWVNDLWLPLKI